MDEKREFLGVEPIGRLMTRLAIPTVLAQVVNLLYNIVDRIYIGRYDSTGIALTGVGVCLSVIMMISAFSSLVGFGGAPRASIFMGRKDYDSAEKTLGNCFALLVLIGLVLTGVLYFYARPILLRFGASSDTIVPAMEYLSVYVIGTVFVQIALGMNSFISAQGFTKVSMYSTLIGAGVNIVLDPILIFVFDLGVRGAALATILSQAVSAAWILFFLSGKKTTIKLQFKNMRLQAGVILPCLALGVSPFIMTFTESVLAVCFNTSLLRYGGDIAVGSMTVVSTLMQFCLMPLQGLTQGAQPITSYNFGARNAERVKQSFVLLLKACMVYSLALWLALQLFPGVFVRLFNNGNPALIEYATRMMRVYCGMLFVMGAQIACQQTLIAVGNAKTSVFLACLRKLILLIPLIYILPVFFEDNAAKAVAVFVAEPVADTLAVTATVILFVRYFKKVLAQLRAPEQT